MKQCHLQSRVAKQIQQQRTILSVILQFGPMFSIGFRFILLHFDFATPLSSNPMFQTFIIIFCQDWPYRTSDELHG